MTETCFCRCGVINLCTRFFDSDNIGAAVVCVGDEFEKINTPLKDMSIKRGVLVGGIVRDKEFILPTGYTTFERGDRIIIVTSVKQITELKQILR